VFAVDNSRRGDGFGGAGLIYTMDRYNINVFDVPPAESKRGLWVGGDSVDTVSGTAYPSVGVVAHEIGHTIHWPHSFSGETGIEYDNPLDVMSNIEVHMCRRDLPGGAYVTWACDAQNTLAFNRFAAGWIDDSQVYLQRGGTNTITLDAPQGSGVQFVGAPDASDSRVMLTIEARPKLGVDQYLEAEGVAVHLIDQRPGACDNGTFYGACLGASRRQQQLPFDGNNAYAQVIPVGGTHTIDGVTVTVLARAGNGFTVQVSGVFAAPAPSPFAFAPPSFATETFAGI